MMSSPIRRAIKAENDAIARRAHESDVQAALDAAQLAIDEYYNGDRQWAEGWLLRAVAANKGFGDLTEEALVDAMVEMVEAGKRIGITPQGVELWFWGAP